MSDVTSLSRDLVDKIYPGEMWFCEDHSDLPWGELCCDPPADLASTDGLPVICEHGACHCGAAGMLGPSDPFPEISIKRGGVQYR